MPTTNNPHPPARDNQRHYQQIKENFAVPEAYIVYDQPPEFFRSPTLPERHELFTRLARTSTDFADAVRLLSRASSPGETSPAVGGAGSGSGSGDRWARDGDDGTGRPRPKKARGAPGGRSRDRVEVTPASPAYHSPYAPTEGEEGEGDEEGEEEEEERGSDGSGRDEWGGQERTLFTTRSADGVYELRRDRPALLVSSTSWTPDEDFSVLLEALRRFDSRTASGASPTLPLVMVVVTGKGPDKARYVELMKAARMSRVAVCTAWLEPQDYPLLLGSADLGICLHTSTSGESHAYLQYWSCVLVTSPSVAFRAVRL